MHKILITIATLAIATSAHADTTVTWDFAAQPDQSPALGGSITLAATDSDGAVRDVTVTGVTIDNVDGPISQSHVTNRNGTGLGACNAQSEQPGCVLPDLAIDNAGFDDAVLFEFDAPIDALTIDLDGEIGGSTFDTEVTVYSGTGAFDESSFFEVRFDDSGTGSRTVVVGLDAAADWVLVSALNDTGGAQDDDHFFIPQITASPLCAASEDIDADGIDNLSDNCLDQANPAQLDSDGDGFGNRCDQDLDNSGTVNFSDLSQLKDAFFSTPASPAWNAAADFDGNSAVNFGDLQIMKEAFFGAPGPSCPARL